MTELTSDKFIPVPIYGLLNSHNPYIGYFHYSPISTRRHDYLSYDITYTAELQRRRQIKFHPLTGCFHFAPGKYSDLHGLEKYRHTLFNQKSSESNSSNSSSNSSNTTPSYDFESTETSRIDKRVTFGLSSRDDAAIVTDRTHDRYGNHKPIYKRSSSNTSTETSPRSPRKGRSRLPTHLNGLASTTATTSATDVAAVTVAPSAASTTTTAVVSSPRTAIALTTPENSWEIHSSSSQSFVPTPHATITATDSITNLPAKYNIGRKVGEGSYAKVYIGTKNTPTALTAATSTMSGHLAIPTPLYHSHPTTPVTTPTATTPIGTPRATTPTPDAKVAVKVIRKSLCSDLSMAIREIENQSKISECRGRGVGGETIVSLKDTYESSDYYYMMMEWCDAGTLEDMLLLRRRLTEEEVKLIAHQLLIGVLYLHTNGIVHADIKPANILFISTPRSSSLDLMYYKKLRDGSLTVTLPNTISGSSASVLEDVDDELLLAQQRCSIDPDSRTPSPQPPTSDPTSTASGETRFRSPYGLQLKICDFGLSQRIPDVKHFRSTGDIHKAPYKMTGTPGFLSPELIRQTPFGRGADMWAVGTVLYLSLCGSLPYQYPSLALERDVSFKGHAWKSVTADGIDLIQGLLQRDENMRTKASDALNHRWFNDISLIYNHGMQK